MYFQTVVKRELPTALGTLVRFFTSVLSFVPLQVALVAKTCWTIRTFERLFTGVSSEMSDEHTVLKELLTTLTAHESFSEYCGQVECGRRCTRSSIQAVF